MSVHRGVAWSRGVSAPGEVPGPGGGCLLRGVPGPREVCAWSLGGCLVPGGQGGVCSRGGGAWWRPPRRLLLQAVRILMECILVHVEIINVLKFEKRLNVHAYKRQWMAT